MSALEHTIAEASSKMRETAARVADDLCPLPANGPFSHTNSMRVMAQDIAAAIRALPLPPTAPLADDVAVMADLLPCPFCGGEAAVQSSWSKGGGFSVTCQTENCMGVNWEQDEQGGFAAEFPTDAGAIAAWNRRALPAAQPAPAVRVKPLVWNGADHFASAYASRLGISYSILSQNGLFHVSVLSTLHASSVASDCPDQPAAKAAAQADYQSRILAAIEPDPELARLRAVKGPGPAAVVADCIVKEVNK